jgi:hypothetical protein
MVKDIYEPLVSCATAFRPIFNSSKREAACC